MKLNELFDGLDLDNLFESAKPIWRRSGNKIVRGYRCVSGKKQGQIVASPGVCTGKVDLKKRVTLKKTKAAKAAVIARKTKKTKTKNPVSKRLQQLNKKAGR